MTLPMPPSASLIWGEGKSAVWSEKKQCWYTPTKRTRKYAMWLAQVEWLGIAQRAADQIPGAYAMRVTAPASGLDLDNLVKPLSDGLQRMRVVANDRHARAILLQVDPARADGTVLVELWALP